MTNETTELRTSGPNAVDRMREILKPINQSGIVAVEVSLVHENNVESTPEPEPEPTRTRDDDRPTVDDRRLIEVRPGTVRYEVLRIVGQAGGPVDSTMVRNIGYERGLDPSTASATLSTLYAFKLLEREGRERETGGITYEYYLSDHGRALLEERDDL